MIEGPMALLPHCCKNASAPGLVRRPAPQSQRTRRLTADATPAFCVIQSGLPLLKSYTFDQRGNLFVDGQASHYFAFAELPRNRKRFVDITLSHKINFPGGVQWDGKYMALGDQATSIIYQFSISGSTGTLEGTTVLNGASGVQQFWIQGHTVIGGDSGGDGYVHYWHYPAGGNFTKTIKKGVGGPIGRTVSKASK
jgi:hypothetical protein